MPTAGQMLQQARESRGMSLDDLAQATKLRATILASLRNLTDEFGISLLYITHDLATAYQVSDTILVMYRANRSEEHTSELQSH